MLVGMQHKGRRIMRGCMGSSRRKEEDESIEGQHIQDMKRIHNLNHKEKREDDDTQLLASFFSSTNL